ncbi:MULTISPECIES: hypothetical protein [Pseudoalteromonas]|uniref:hypothetical protein n=1 Tax=Pseudoalteromonas TaxID=53246 RepID=UPI000F772DF9|nr:MULTISPECIES: hypothetical protein [Pseudoalteromonas]MCG7561090.1 hypothetical protein [Pseudoalteromonas sp. McH1-42]MEC4088171.1 hypothetical protein [Pseudoalteromonas rubra]
MQKLLSLFLFILLSLPSYACGDGKESENVPFAKLDEKYKLEELRLYQIFVPEKNGEYFLTSIYMYKKNEQHISVKFTDAFVYPGYKAADIAIHPDLVKSYDIYLNYSTTEDGDLVMCGGQIIKLNISKLLEVKSPPEVIPPPPEPRKVH